MLDEGVVAGPEDIDLAMITGAGLPVLERRHHARCWTGRGLSETVTGRRFLPAGVASVPA